MCLSIGHDSIYSERFAETGEPIKVPLGVRTRVGRKESFGLESPMAKGALLGVIPYAKTCQKSILSTSLSDLDVVYFIYNFSNVFRTVVYQLTASIFN